LEGAPPAQLPPATLWLDENRLSIRSAFTGLIFGASKRKARKLLKIASMMRVFWGFAEVAEFKSV
jgi:hypothetical protein